MTSKVLVADDDPRVRRVVVTTLGGVYQLFEARDGEQALAVARREMPDLLLLDVRMPVFDGLEVCRRIKGDPLTAHLRVVMLTGLGADEDRKAGERAGADAYFVKPFSPRALLNQVTELLESVPEPDPSAMRRSPDPLSR